MGEDKMKPATFVLRLWQRPDGLRLELSSSQGQREVFKSFKEMLEYLEQMKTDPPLSVIENQ